jgi:hypothetical protein
VYGSPYDEGKSDFIQELHSLLDNWDGPTLIGGDFNLVSSVKDKNNGIVNHRWLDLFQEWIHTFGLLELKNSSRSYTWTNNQDRPIMAAIDKLLCNTLFEQKFPLAFVTAKSWVGSDHVPLILDFGCHEVKKPNLFRFEKWWLEQPGFKQLANKIWNTDCVFEDAMEIWQFKIRLLRKKIKGWAININVDIKKQKNELLKEFDSLNRRYESGLLSPDDKEKMDRIVGELEKIWRLEEIKLGRDLEIDI